MGKRLILAWLPLLFAGCSSAFTVKSDPLQVDLFVLDPKNGDKKSLGKTPFDTPMSALRKTLGEGVLAGDYFTLVIEKKDYVSQSILVPTSRFGTMVTSLDIKLKKGNNQKESEAAKEVLDLLFVAQKFALAKEYERAQIELDKIFVVYPDFARALSMRASIYYMQRKFEDSLKWYDEALRADPQMEEAIKMVAKIHKSQGTRVPASAPPKAPGAKP